MLILEISSSCCCISSFLILSASILEASIVMSTDRSTLGLSALDSVLNPKKLLRLLALLLLFKLDPLEDFGIGLNKVGSRLQICLLTWVGLVLQWITGGLQKRGFSNDRLEAGNVTSIVLEGACALCELLSILDCRALKDTVDPASGMPWDDSIKYLK